MQSVSNEPQSDARAQLAPLLDDALGQLGAKDHDAVMLRFLEGKSLSEVGQALGGSEDAAKMRVSRALEKLRRFFAKRGVTLSAAAIAGAVSANSVQAAPAVLAKSVSAAALAKGAAATGSTLALVKGTLRLMLWTKAKTSVITTAAIILAAGTTSIAVRTSHGAQAADKTDAALQGTWLGQETGGPTGQCRMTVTGDTIKFQGARPQEWYEGKMTLVQNVTPKRSAILITDCPVPQYTNTTAHAIYKIEGKTLTIAGNEPGNAAWPTGFERSQVNQTRVFVFTKQ